MREPGIYWVRYPLGRNVWTAGEYKPGGNYPWQIIGSDSIFREEELEIGPMIPRFDDPVNKVTQQNTGSSCEVCGEPCIGGVCWWH